MMRHARWLLLLTVFACGEAAAPASEESAGQERASTEAPTQGCEGLAVQVLGSGGPRSVGGRASTSYLLWVDGRARLLVDLGPGGMLRFGETGARPADLDAILISHFHVDHAADLPAFFKRTNFGERDAPLPLFGPVGNERFPAASAFVDAELREAYAYLHGFLEGEPYQLEVNDVPIQGQAQELFERDGLRVRAVGVPHGPVPALAYRIDLDGHSVAFMGDQRADESRYVDLIRDVDLLVAHMAIPERSPGIAAQLHAPPGRLGRVARDAGVRSMVLSHLMERALASLDQNVAAVREQYEGTLMTAHDLGCYPIPD